MIVRYFNSDEVKIRLEFVIYKALEDNCVDDILKVLPFF